MIKILSIILTLLISFSSVEAKPLNRAGTSGATFPTCLGPPANATIVGPNGSFSYLGWTYVAQNPVSVQVLGTVFSSPICGGLWRDNTDPNTLYFYNYSQEFDAFDQARQTRSEIAPSTVIDTPPTYGINTTYRNLFEIYVDSNTNVSGVDFATLAQTHSADTYMGGNVPPNTSNALPGVFIGPPAIYGVNMYQTGAGQPLSIYNSVTYSTGVPSPRGTPPSLVLPKNPSSGLTLTPLGSFNTWHTIEKIENDGHGGQGAFKVILDGVTIADYYTGTAVCTNYVVPSTCTGSGTATGQTGFEFVDLLRTNGGPIFGTTGSSFTGYISGTTLTVSSVTTGTVAINEYPNVNNIGGGVGSTTSGTKILSNISGSGAGSTWLINNSQTLGSVGSPVAMVAALAQPTHSYQKMGQYWGMGACNSTGANVVGSISGTVLTVASNSSLVAGQAILGTGVTSGTILGSFISGLTWNVNISQTVASTTLQIGEPWCHYPPVGDRFIGARRNQISVYLDYSAVADTGTNTGGGQVGVAYSKDVIVRRASSSTSTPTCSISTGSVPGLSIATGSTVTQSGGWFLTTCTISGTPTTANTYQIVLSAVDPEGTTSSPAVATGAALTITIAP